MGDVNKTTHTGTAITAPSFITQSNGTPLAIFTLSVKESWVDRLGKKCFRNNLIKMEALKKNAFWVRDHVKVGKRYYIDGYVRYDCINNVEERKIRILHIIEEDTDEFNEGKRLGYREGLTQALAIMQNSDTLGAAQGKISLLVD